MEIQLLKAVNLCNNPDLEEEGGVILQRGNEFKFIKLTNTNTGLPIAPVLWTADRMEYAKQVLPLFREGWTQAASFHTHPCFLPLPSGIDMFQLFPGFPLNFIYAPMHNIIVGWRKAPESSEELIEVDSLFELLNENSEIVKIEHPAERLEQIVFQVRSAIEQTQELEIV
jgi:hypothetical protein